MTRKIVKRSTFFLLIILCQIIVPSAIAVSESSKPSDLPIRAVRVLTLVPGCSSVQVIPGVLFCDVCV